MAKVRAYVNHQTGMIGCYSIHCPACDMEHPFSVGRWEYNGNMDRPTFAPSMLIKIPLSGEPSEAVCHSFVRDGRIEYLGDCTHAMAGQTVDLPDIID